MPMGADGWKYGRAVAEVHQEKQLIEWTGERNMTIITIMLILA